MSTSNNKVPPVNWKKKFFQHVENLNAKYYGGRVPEEVPDLLKETESPEVPIEFHSAEKARK